MNETRAERDRKSQRVRKCVPCNHFQDIAQLLLRHLQTLSCFLKRQMHAEDFDTRACSKQTEAEDLAAQNKASSQIWQHFSSSPWEKGPAENN